MIRRLILIIIAVGALFIPLNAIAQDSSELGIDSRDERLAKAVSEQQIVLDETAKSIIQTKCKTAQDILKGVQDNTDTLVRRRLDLYGDVQKELQAIKLRMIRQGADASETDLLTGRLQQVLDNFTIQANRYGSALDDVINVDCVQKPEQFRAALFIVRAQRIKLLDLALNLKATLTNSQNNVFDQLKKRLVI